MVEGAAALGSIGGQSMSIPVASTPSGSKNTNSASKKKVKISEAMICKFSVILS